jgi:hypothetical protein
MAPRISKSSLKLMEEEGRVPVLYWTISMNDEGFIVLRGNVGEQKVLLEVHPKDVKSMQNWVDLYPIIKENRK